MIEIAASGGLLVGLGALWRGFKAQRTGAWVEGLGTSPIATLAAGEVRVSGIVEDAGVTLTSPILARACVYYASRLESRTGDERETWSESRAVGFFVRDATGAVRVLPRDARWDLPLDVDDSSGLTRPFGGAPGTLPADDAFHALSILVAQRDRAPERMTEAVLEPGDPVTVIGIALPYRDLTDRASADAYVPVDPGDVEVAGDLAEARAAGMLAANPEEAWGNAAIPGFGIGAPNRQPELDAGVQTSRNPAGATAAPTLDARFQIPEDTLVLASTADVPMLIAGGVPGEVTSRNADTFLLGMLGAVLAIGSAIVLAIALSDGWG